MPFRIFRFGIHRLDAAARELHRDGKLVPMSPMMFDCLAWLFEHRERAVGRDELSAAVWGRVDITDAQIDQLIRKVRRVVGDTGTAQGVIRTIPRFGYRWVAEVQVEAPAAETVFQAPPETPQVESIAPHAPKAALAGHGTFAAGPPLRRWAQLIAGIALLAIIIALALALYLRGTQGAGAIATTGLAADAMPRQAGTVAVLPVATDDDLDSEWSWLRLGLMDLIATRLHEGGLTVVPANNIMALSRNGDAARPDAATVQAATGASIIISPTLRKTSSGWRLHLDLHGAENVAHEVQAYADSAVATARSAADRLLVLLGKSPSVGDDTVRASAGALIYRIDAAIDGGDHDAARHLLDNAPPMWRDDGVMRLRRARLERAAGHTAAARQLFESVLDSHAQSALDPVVHTEALIGAGVILLEEGRSADGRSRLDEAIELAHSSNLPLLYGDAMASRAVLNAAEGNATDADRDFAQARIALELAGDTLGLAELEANQAGVLTHRHRYGEAHTLLDRAIARMQRFPPGETLVSALGNRIFLHLAMLESRDALAVAEHASDTVDRVENLWKRQAFLLHKVRALMANGRLRQADQLLQGLGAHTDPQQPPHLQASLLGSLAQRAFSRSHWSEAAELAAAQLEILTQPTLSTPLYARMRSVAWLTRVRSLQHQGATAQAATEMERFAKWAGSQHDPAISAHVNLALAEQAVREQRVHDAIPAFENALATANRSAGPADVAMVAAAYGAHLIETADLEGATRIVGQTAHWAGQDFDCALLQVRLYHALGQDKAWQEALATARSLAGERPIPTDLMLSPLAGQPMPNRIIDLSRN